MKPFQSYILVLDQHPDDLQMLESVLNSLSSSVVIASSAAQAMDKISQAPPYLVILTGGRQNWSHTLVSQLRAKANAANLTIVALTDVHAPSWQHQEDNPGLDGFLVKPLTGDVMMSLVQSALARQTYCSA